jgi:hypothetical protein
LVELIWEDFGVLRRMTMQVTAAELDSYAIQIQESARLDDLDYVIHDFTEATDVMVSQNDIEFMAVRASIALEKNPRVRIAFVGHHPVVHALIDAFNNLGGSQNRCHHFDTLEEARTFTSV